MDDEPACLVFCGKQPFIGVNIRKRAVFWEDIVKLYLVDDIGFIVTIFVKQVNEEACIVLFQPRERLFAVMEDEFIFVKDRCIVQIIIKFPFVQRFLIKSFLIYIR